MSMSIAAKPGGSLLPAGKRRGRRIVSWLAGWDPGTCAVVAVLVSRAYAAGWFQRAADTELVCGAVLAGSHGLSAAETATVVGALAGAAGLIREQATRRRDGELAPAAVCGYHAEALAGAGDCDRLAALLGGQR